MAKQPQAAKAAETEPKEKGAVCKKVYITPEGESRSAKPDATALEFRFTNGETRVVKKGDNPDDIELDLDWFGRSEKYGNLYAGVKGDVPLAVEKFDAGAELLAAGEWSERKEGVGPTPTMVVEAIARALEKTGETVDDKRRESIKAKITHEDKEKQKTLRANALVNSAVAAEYEAIKAEKAAERAAKAAEKAETESADLSQF